jgi:hypothetical protein
MKKASDLRVSVEEVRDSILGEEFSLSWDEEERGVVSRGLEEAYEKAEDLSKACAGLEEGSGSEELRLKVRGILEMLDVICHSAGRVRTLGGEDAERFHKGLMGRLNGMRTMLTAVGYAKREEVASSEASGCERARAPSHTEGTFHE